MQGGSLYHFYDGLWYDLAERRTHDLPCKRRTRYRLSQPDTVDHRRAAVFQILFWNISLPWNAMRLFYTRSKNYLEGDLDLNLDCDLDRSIQQNTSQCCLLFSHWSSLNTIHSLLWILFLSQVLIISKQICFFKWKMILLQWYPFWEATLMWDQLLWKGHWTT